MPDGGIGAETSGGLLEKVAAEGRTGSSAEVAPPVPMGVDAGWIDPVAELPAGTTSGGFFAPLRVVNFRRLIAGQTVSRLGDQFYFVALPWLVLRVADSAAALALVSGVSAAMLGVFTLTGGVLADRYGPRALMLGADVARLLTISV
ncbi:MAG: MFS transporter, partial [Ktedonobacterales bacterium]